MARGGVRLDASVSFLCLSVYLLLERARYRPRFPVWLCVPFCFTYFVSPPVRRVGYTASPRLFSSSLVYSRVNV